MDLEMKVSFLEDGLGQLDQVVCQQRLQIESLLKQVAQLLEQQQQLVDRVSGNPSAHEIPPHY